MFEGGTRAMRLCSRHRIVSLPTFCALRGSLLVVLAIASIIANLRPAVAGEHGANKTGRTTVAYFLEFRARGGVVGHTFMIAGRVLDSGKRVREHHFGFSAQTGGIESLIGTPGTIGPQPLDFKEPTLARFNVRLSYNKYRQLERALRRARTRAPTFRLLSVNCNYFAGYMARSVGLRASPRTFVHPTDYVLNLARLNSRLSQLSSRGKGRDHLPARA
jgi:hypothetical protein